ncbi:MAG: hypothetical protein KAG34_04000 [Cocleimonas sp.]|nr:hypothetical protein [Cocleimonas sp.]
MLNISNNSLEYKAIKLALLLMFSLSLSLLNGCSVSYKNVKLENGNRPVARILTNKQKRSINGLARALLALGPNTSKAEADAIAYDAIVYPMILANQYNLVYPPQLQNILVNGKRRDRGLCWQWADDMTAHMKKKNLKTFDLLRGTANRRLKNEHNSLVVVAKGAHFYSGIMLDPWRNSGDLYWEKVTNDEDPQYTWHEFVN